MIATIIFGTAALAAVALVIASFPGVLREHREHQRYLAAFRRMTRATLAAAAAIRPLGNSIHEVTFQLAHLFTSSDTTEKSDR